MPVDAILANADDYTSDEIVTEIFQGVMPEVARRIIGFARQHVVTAFEMGWGRLGAWGVDLKASGHNL